MIKALWFMVKIGVLVALAIWVAERPGEVEIEWLNYTIRIHVGLFLFALLCLILLSIFIYNTIKTFVDFPKSYKRYREVKDFEKGYRALTLGLTSVAAGDVKHAAHQAERVGKLMPEDTGLALLLKAQAARMQGRDEQAQEAFAALLNDKDAAFLGARGLLQMALEMDDEEQAMALAYQALDIHPKQPWILMNVYEMEVRLRDWNKALETLRRAEKYGALSKAEALSDRVAILHVQAEDLLREGKRDEALKLMVLAHKLDKEFVPSIVLLARLTHQAGNRRRAVKLVEKAWANAPHPDLAKVWEDLISGDRSKKPLGRTQWFERLLSKNSSSAQGHIEAGRIATEQGLWGEARKHFERAQEIRPSAQLYHLWAALEERVGQNEEAIQMWLEKAEVAAPSPQWVCDVTGRAYGEWHPIAQPHGAFNTIQWSVPKLASDVQRLARASNNDGALEAPKRLG